MAKKKAAKKAAKAAGAPKARAAAKKAAKPSAAKVKAAAKPKAAAKAKAPAQPKAAPRPRRGTSPKAAAKKAPKKAARRQPPPSPTNSERLQAEVYAKAVESFQAGRIKRALGYFETVAEGPDSGLRHRAHVHIKICRRRTESDTIELKTAEDHYNYSVKLINDRRLEEADKHLDKALKKATGAGYIHYAKAVVAALNDDKDRVHKSLNRAIELDPKHRLQARRDPDMAGIRDDAEIAELLQGDAPAADS